MKKIIFSLVATVLLSFSGNAQDLNQLGRDRDFVRYIQNEYAFASRVSTQEAQEAVTRIAQDNTLQESELPLFYQAFNTTNQEYKTFAISQRTILSSLESKYSIKKFTQGEINTILVPYIKEIITSQVTVAERRNCRGVYIAQLALNASVAYGAHVACLSVDITVIGGILCHGAVAGGQVAANYIAYEDYKECAGL